MSEVIINVGAPALASAQEIGRIFADAVRQECAFSFSHDEDVHARRVCRWCGTKARVMWLGDLPLCGRCCLDRRVKRTPIKLRRVRR